MKQNRTIIWSLLLFYLSFCEAWASTPPNHSIAISSQACEEIRKGEPKSSTRVRVTDKASYIAVENMSILESFRKDFSEHDFNVLVYDLVDNYVQDLTVKPISQDSEKICVEINAFLSPREVQKRLQNTMESIMRRGEAAEDDLSSPPEETRPQPKQSLYPEIAMPQPEDVFKPMPEDDNPLVVSIYFAPTVFYNNTASSKFTDILKQQFSKKDNWKITLQKDRADYTVKSEVMRAKVDPINASTNRLQMVIALELENAKGESLIKEHQNRFVLFTAEEDEQEVAFKLLKKLFETAGNLLMKKIAREGKSPRPDNPFPEIITPSH